MFLSLLAWPNRTPTNSDIWTMDFFLHVWQGRIQVGKKERASFCKSFKLFDFYWSLRDLRDFCLVHTQNLLGRFNQFLKIKLGIFASNFEITFTFRIREFTT